MGWIYIVPQAHCVIIERLGKFARVEGPGLHFRWPFIESQKNVIDDCGWGSIGSPHACKPRGSFTIIEMADQRLDTAKRNCHTKDNVEVRLDSAIFWRITNPQAAVYAVDRLIVSLIDLALNSMRSNIGMMTLDDVLSKRQELNENIARDVSDTSKKWGIDIQRVEIQELEVDEKTKGAMRAEMEAERTRRAMLLEAEGRSRSTVMEAEAEKQAHIAKAEAEKTAAILRAEGESRSRELLADADAKYLETIIKASNVSPQEALKLLIAQRYIDGFDAISKNPADKVFLPNSLDGLNLFVNDKSKAQ